MSASGSNKRALSKQGGQPKKVKCTSGMAAFLDIEAKDSSDDEGYDQQMDAPDKEVDLTQCDSQDEEVSRCEPMVHSPSSLVHGGPSGVRGLGEVISRYEGRPSTSSDPWAGESENEEELFLPLKLQEAGRLPSVQDPDLWAIPIFEGKGRDTFSILYDRLKNQPHLAQSVVMPPKFTSYVLVEATDCFNVLQLCQNVSTIPQPPGIKIIPIEERAAWLRAPEPQMFDSRDSWVRIRPRSVLREMGALQGLERYTGDLALVFGHSQSRTASLLLIPRLPVKQPGQQRAKRLQRLLHPFAFPGQVISSDRRLLMATLQFDPKIFWYPGKKLEMEPVEEYSDVYQFVDRRQCRDHYARPFAVFEDVPVSALVIANVHPTREELHLFSEGLDVGMAELNLGYVSVKFMVDSYHTYLAAPLEEGHRVEVNTGNAALRGNITGTGYNSVDVYIEEHQASLTVESKRVRRVFLVGDSVRVFSSKSLYAGRMGWVLGEFESTVRVLDEQTKEDVKAWELVPFDIEHRAAPLALCAEKEGRGHQAFGYDRYRELVNTKVVVGGQHPEKTLRGRIRSHLSGCIMRVELESGMRMVDIHVNFLFPTEKGGHDPRSYHVGETIVPRDAEYSWPQPQPALQPQCHTRASTPTASDPDPAPTGTIKYDGQVLQADWLLKDGLAEKRIWTRIRNSRPDPFVGGESGFSKGRYEDSRALTLRPNVAGAVDVHVKKNIVTIPCCYLFPEQPTSRGQKVAVISGDHVGEVFLTRKLTEDGWFRLVKPGSKGAAEFIIEPGYLARCDA